jgi:hypothetical protein
MPMSWALVALCALTSTAWAWQGAPDSSDPSAAAGAASLMAPPPGLSLELAPVQGITTAWHRAPAGFTVPEGEIVTLRQTASPGMAVVWSGADEIARTDEHSLASLPLSAVGLYEVRVELYPHPLGEGQVPEGFHWTHGCVIAATDADLSQTALGDIAANVPAADLGEETVGSDGLQLYFADESIADLSSLRQGWYVTSVKRLVQMEVGAANEALLPLIEWRVDGEAEGLGPEHQLRFLEPGTHTVEAGPPGHAAAVRLDAYRVDIVRKWPADGWPDGAPLTFLAETDPPGLESYIRWLAADKLGSASPITATGPVFTTSFTGSYGPSGNQQAWMGVKADDAYLGADTSCHPLPVMMSPQDGELISDAVLLMVDQVAACVSDEDMDRVRFEYSDDGGQSWTQAAQLTGPVLNSMGYWGAWEARWDLSTLPSGSYDVRATMRLPGQASVASPPVTVSVNLAPVVLASATGGGAPGQVFFDASGSEDPDGTLVDLTWDFGDGTTGTGATTTHTYVDLGQSYHVSVTATDDAGTGESQYYVALFLAPDIVQFALGETCICTGLTLRGHTAPPVPVLGKDAAIGGTDWSSGATLYDGKTAGPLGGNPGNAPVGTKKKYLGYAFEVVATVFGNPDKCKEIQLRRDELRLPGLTAAECVDDFGIWEPATSTCLKSLPWVGTSKDLDLDGTPDLVVDTLAKCTTAGGIWDGAFCILHFPLSAGEYGPDEFEQGEPGGAYEETSGGKVHLGQKAVWIDAPHTLAKPVGKEWNIDFVAILRGTDGKACYLKYEFRSEVKAGQNDESLTLTESSPPGGVVNIPGLP